MEMFHPDDLLPILCPLCWSLTLHVICGVRKSDIEVAA